MLQIFARTLAAALLAGCTLNRPLAALSPAASPADAGIQTATLSVPTPTTPPASTSITPPTSTSSAAPLTATGAAQPPLTALSSVATPEEPSPAPSAKLRRLLKREVTRGIARQARRIIDAYAGEPFGTEIPFDVEGKRYVARIEQHYHEPGGELRPWGPHPGVSVFVAKSGS